MPNQNMIKLEKRFYSREEIAKIVEVDAHNKNFKRKIVDTLQKWGYSYEYTKKGVTILAAPQTIEQRIAEIAQRVLNLDVRCDSSAFAAFLFLLQCDEEFNISPWIKKAELMKEQMGIIVSDRTLRTWAKKLIDNNIIIKDNEEKVLWYTIVLNGEKYQEMLNTDDEGEIKAYEQYTETRTQLFEKEKAAGNEKPWEAVFSALWNKFHIVYYYCKPFQCNAILNDDLKEMLNLVEDMYTFEDGRYNLDMETEEIHIFK